MLLFLFIPVKYYVDYNTWHTGHLLYICVCSYCMDTKDRKNINHYTKLQNKIHLFRFYNVCQKGIDSNLLNFEVVGC